MANYGEMVDVHSAQQLNPMQTVGLAPGQDSQSALELMFGPSTTTQSKRFGQDVSSTHQDLYAAYEGDNLYLADTIVGFVLRNIEWYTSVVPWLQTNQMHVKWNTFEFNRTLAQAVPAEGVSRLISHKTREHTGSVSRYGLAFVMEGDMIGSEEGRVMYRRNIQGISQSCQETVNFHTIHQLLACKNYRKERQDLMRRDGETLEAIEDLESLDFAILAYQREGFTRMIETQRDLIRDHDGEADALIVFPRFTWYDAMVLQGTYTEYYQTGPRGIQILTQGPIAPATYRGIPVFESRDFNVYEGGVRIQPMAARASVGEYYPVTFEPWRNGRLPADYESRWRDVAVYDISKDHYKKIGFKDIFLHSNMFGGQAGDPDGLNPQIYSLMQDLNAAFDTQHGGFDDEARIYGNPGALETTDTTRPPRRVYMHLSHNVQKRAVQPVKKFAEFDIDVIPTNDMLQAANSLVDKMFTGGEQAAVRTGIASLMELVERLEAAPYNDAFLRALANENIDQSVDSAGAFVGALRRDVSEVIDWNPNAYGGLDLPARAANAWPVEGFGMASYPMIASLAAQGEARGYAEAGDDLVARAKQGVATVKRIAAALHSVAKESDAASGQSAPDWFKANRADASVFNNLFVSRPPLFLGVPAGQASAGTQDGRANVVDGDGNAIEVDEEAETSVVLWQNGRPGTALVSSGIPRQELLVAILSADQNTSLGQALQALANDTVNTAPLDNFVQALFTDAGANRVDEAEKVRGELIDGLWKLFETHGGKAENAPFASEAVNDFLVANLGVANATLANSAKLLGDLEQATKVAPKSYARKVKALGAKTSQAAKDNKALGERLLKLASGAAIAVPIGGGNATLPSAEQLNAVEQVLTAPIRAGSATTLGQVLSGMRDAVQARGMALSAAAGQRFSLADFDGFVEALVVSGAADAQVAALKKAYQEYEVVLGDVDEKITAATGSSRAAPSPSPSTLRAGNAVPVARAAAAGAVAAWYRAPLAASPAGLRSLAAATGLADGLPMVLPADPKQDYRAYVAPVQGAAIDVDKLSMLMADPIAAPIIAGRLEAGKKQLYGEPHIRALKTAGEWHDPHADFRHVRAGQQGGDALSIGMRRLADNTVAFEDEASIAARAESINAQRAARGQAPRQFTGDFQRAEEQRRSLEREYALAQARASAAAQLHTGGLTSADLEMQRAADALNPVKRAAARSQHIDLAAPVDPVSRAHAAASAQYAYRRGAYAGARDSRSSQWQINKHADLLPDPAYTRESRTYYYDPAAAPHGDYHHPHGHGLGYDAERGYAIAADASFQHGRAPQSYQGAGAGAGPVMYDRYGRPYYRGAVGGVVLGRDGRPIASAAAGDQAMDESDEYHDALHPNAVYRFAKAQEIRDPLARLGLLTLYEMPNKASSWLSLIEQNVHVPINFLLWRLHIEFDMYTCILMQSGIETAANMLGPSNMVFTNSGADKMMHGHFTFHHAPMVFKEEYVRHLRNVYPKRYVAGWDTQWIQSKEELSEDRRASLIATALPITENVDKSSINFIDITKPRLLSAVTNRSKAQRVLPDHSSAAYYEKIWGLSEVELQRSALRDTHFETEARVNVKARRGKFWSYNPQSDSFGVKHHGTGHLSGNRTGPGVAKVWRGLKREVLPDQLQVEQSMIIQ